MVYDYLIEDLKTLFGWGFDGAAADPAVTCPGRVWNIEAFIKRSLERQKKEKKNNETSKALKIKLFQYREKKNSKSYKAVKVNKQSLAAARSILLGPPSPSSTHPWCETGWGLSS